MSTQRKPLDELLEELSPHSQAEVRDFAEFLLAKRKRKSVRKLRQSWAGALSDLREEYTSLASEKVIGLAGRQL